MDEDELNEVVMAVDMRERGAVGCAYYVAQSESFYFMDDFKLGGVDIIDMCKISNSHRSETTKVRQ